MASHLFAPNHGAVTRESCTLRIGTAKDSRVDVGVTGRYMILYQALVVHACVERAVWRLTLRVVRYTTPDLHCCEYELLGYFCWLVCTDNVVRGGDW